MHLVLAALRRHFIGTVFLLLCLLLLQRPAGAVGFAHNYGEQLGSGITEITAMVADLSGNRYIAGNFSGSTLILGGTTVTAIGGQDAFVAKLNSSGALLWVKSFGGSTAITFGLALAVDGSGNPYLGGYFYNGELTTPALTTIGSIDAFVIKLDAASGSTTWAKNFGGSGADVYGRALAVDAAGNPYLGGYFAHANLTTPALTAIGDFDAFIIKLDATTGGTTWSKNFGGSGAVAFGQALAVDGAGNPYLGGWFSGNLTAPVLAPIGIQDAFVIKLDATTGGTTWSKNFGGSGADAIGQTLAVDGSGNPYLGGYFRYASLTTPALTQIGELDSFVIKLNAASGSMLWSKSVGGSGASAYGQALAVDGAGNPYLGGYFNGANLTTPALTQIGTQDAFVIKFNAASGGTTWSKNVGGSGASAFGNALAVDAGGTPYLGGYFNGANLTTPALTQIGSTDAFVIKLNAASGGTTSTEHYFGLKPGGNTQIHAAAVDASGNQYITGYLDDATLTLGGITLTRIGEQDAFVAKLDSSGAVLWAKNFGGSGAFAVGYALALDGAGNPHLVGYFDSANMTTPALTKTGSIDAFLIKLNAASGSTTWSKNFGGSGTNTYGLSLAVDGSGNPYLGGGFSGANMTTPALTKIGTHDAFVIKLNAASGSTAWSKNFGGSGASAYGVALAVDGAGNPYMGGDFSGANLTTPALTRTGNRDAFVIKLNAASGSTTWSKNFGGSGGANAYGQTLAVDGSGNPYLGGYFNSANLTTPALTKIGTRDAFVIKLDAASGTTTWSKNFGGSGANVQGNALAVDSVGNPYLGGYFYTSNLTTPALSKIGDADAFVIKLNAASGSTAWSRNFGGSGAEAYGQALAVDSSGNPYLGGYFQYANLTTPALTKIGTQDAFFLSLVQVTYSGNGSTGGSVPIDSHAYFTGDNVTVLSNSGTLVKTGATFIGWNTAANGSGTNYNASGSATFTMGFAAVTLFAQWAPPPTVTAINPASGPTAGSASVTITGTNFLVGATTVKIGGATCTSPNVTSATALTCTTPAGSAGTASVVATTAGGTNAANTLYTYVAPPTVTAINPASGPTAGGAAVTITGTNFVIGATTVKIGGATCTAPNVTSATSLTCTTPAGTAGTASVVATTVGGSNGGNTLYTYVSPPTVTTTSASNLSLNGATLNGSVNANGASTAVTFDYGATGAYGTHVAAIPSTVAAGASTASVTIAGLNCSSVYHFRINGVSVGGTTNGNDLSFATSLCTLPGAPTIIAATAGSRHAQINFTAPAGNGGTPIFSYIATCTAAAQSTKSASRSGSPIFVSGMQAGVTYSCSVAATNAVGTGASSQSLPVQPKKNILIPEIMLLLFD